jgi:hypothetical protein
MSKAIFRGVINLVTHPAADIHRSFCSEPREKGGASPLRGPLVLGMILATGLP